MNKRIVKIVILFVLISAVLIGGIYMYKRLDYDKQSFNTCIYDYIPPNAIQVININREHSIRELSAYAPHLQKTINEIFYNTVYPPLVVIQYKRGKTLFVSKINQEQKDRIIKHIEEDVSLPFIPKTTKYKDIDIYVYALPENRFLCISYNKGLLVTSADYKLIEDFIDTDPENTFFSDERNKEKIKDFREKTPLSIYTYTQSGRCKSALELTTVNDTILLKGFLFGIDKKDNIWIKNNYSPQLINIPDSMCIEGYDLQLESEPIEIGLTLNKIY